MTPEQLEWSRTRDELVSMSQCCMAFELVYSESRKIVSEQGYLDKFLSVGTEGPAKDQMEMLRAEIKKAWEETE